MDSSLFYPFAILIPFAVGVGFGTVVWRQSWPWLALLLVSPLVAAFVTFLLFYGLTIIFYTLNQQWRNDYPLYVQALGATLFYVSSILLYGLLPAVGGYLLSSFVATRD
jgi:hypothetical protein